MNALASDEKATLVMAYTPISLIRGEVVLRESVRVSTWLRTDGAPDYIHLLNPQMLSLAGGAAKSFTFSELYLPTDEVVGFHLVPPAQDSPDYDPSEMNRVMAPTSAFMGAFIFKGSIRISTQSDLGTSITTARTAWLSMYDVEISSPYLPQMKAINVPMVIVRPDRASFAL